MNKELQALERIRNTLLVEGYWQDILQDVAIIEAALNRNIELEEEIKVLEIIRDNFDLWIESEYRATLEFSQCCSMSQGEYEKFIEYFGEPRDE